MATNSPSIDKTEAGSGVKYTCQVGSGGVTAGQTVKYDGVTNNVIIACSAKTDEPIGYARDTASSAGYTTVLSDGCLVLTGQTLTVGGLVEPSAAGTTQDDSGGTTFGVVHTAATSASVVRVLLGIGD